MKSESKEATSLIALTWAHKRLVGIIALSMIVISVLYTAIADPIWEAKAKIIFPPRSYGSNLGDELVPSSFFNAPTPLKVYTGILGSERTIKYVADDLKIKREEVRRMRSIIDQPTENTITIVVRHKNSDVALRVLRSHLEALQKINRSLITPLVAGDMETLRKEVENQEKKVVQLEHQVLSFYRSAKTAPEFQSAPTGKDTAIVPTMAKWGAMERELEVKLTEVNGALNAARSYIENATSGGSDLVRQLPSAEKWRTKLTELEYELQIKELTFAPESSELRKLRNAIEITRKQLRSELAAYAKASNLGVFDASLGTQNNLPSLVAERIALQAQLNAVRRLAKLAPEETIQLTRLTRELMAESGALLQLKAQFRSASLEEQKNPNRWEILDEPEVAEKPINKNFPRNAIFGLLGGIALGVAAAVLSSNRKNANNVGQLHQEKVLKSA